MTYFIRILKKCFTWKLCLILFLILAIVWILIQNIIQAKLEEVLEKNSKNRVAQIQYEDISFSLLTGSLVFTQLKLPQFKIEGVPDSTLRDRAILECQRLEVTLDWMAYLNDDKIVVENCSIQGAVFAKDSEFRVAHIECGNISFSPPTGILILTQLKIPQIKIEGVPDSMLKKRAVFECQRLGLKFDWETYLNKNKIIIKNCIIEEAVFGAVLDPAISRISLASLPGVFLGHVPVGKGAEEWEYVKVDYELEKLDVRGKIVFDPSSKGKTKNLSPVIFENFRLQASNVRNVPIKKNQKKSIIEGSCQLGKGSIKFEFTSPTFDEYLTKGDGRLMVKGNHLPLKEITLVVNRFKQGVRFDSGLAEFDWLVDIKNSELKPKKTLLKVSDAKLSLMGAVRLDPLLKAAVFIFNSSGGEFSKSISLKGNLTHFYVENREITF